MPRKVAQLLDRDETNDSTSDGWEAWIESEPKGEYRSGLEFSHCLSSLTLREAVEKNLVSFRWWGLSLATVPPDAAAGGLLFSRMGPKGRRQWICASAALAPVRLTILGIVVDLCFFQRSVRKQSAYAPCTHASRGAHDGRCAGRAILTH